MKKWIEVAMLFAIAGCSSIPEKPVTKQAVSVKEPVREEVKSKLAKSTAIDANTLYLLLAAELAGQRRQYRIALDAYLQAAERVKDPRVAERAAKIALFLKDRKKTEQAVSLWLQEDPGNLTARKIALLSALRNTDKEDAVRQLDAYLQADPAGFESVLLEIARVMERDRKVDFLYGVLDELAQKHPQQASIYFVQSLLASKQKRLDAALEKINQAINIQPDWKKALLLRARIVAQKGDLKKTEEYLLQIADKYPDDLKVKKMLAQVYMEEKRYDDAIDVYEEILQDNPGDSESQFALGLIYLQKKELDKAEEAFKKVQHDSVWRFQSSYYLGRIAREKGDYDQALVWFDSITSGPYEFDARLAAISLLLEQKKYQMAEQRVNDLEQAFPGQEIRISLLKAEIYSEKGAPQQAFDVLTEALKQFPDNKDLLYTRALVAEQLDRIDILERDLNKILEKNPNDAAALNALGYTLVDKTERYDEAEKYLKKALELEPDAAVIIDSYGWLKYKQGDLQAALEYLKKAYEKQQENEIAAHLAEVLWVSGQKDEAVRIFEKAFEKAPDDKYLLKFKKHFLSGN